MTAADAREVRRRLLSWYDANARELPWRSNPTPYAVLLSELMLQQTRVDTALPYFRRFLERWPSLEDLAAAAEDEVVAAWAGLGYYSRARNLHRAARMAVDAGGLPATFEGLRALPGVGDYTAGAVASIAFGRSVPAVDGNVERVLSRLDGLEDDPKGTAARRVLRARAASITGEERPGDVNQALMELGALVCSPRRPDCGRCPWQEPCAARASGEPERFPTKATKAAPKPMEAVHGLLTDGRAVLMGRRPPGLLGGLWEPVGEALTDGTDPRKVLVDAFARRAGVRVRVGAELGRVVHVFSHRRLTARVFAVHGGESAGTPDASYEAMRWIDPASPGDKALSRLCLKLVELADPVAPMLPLAAEPEVRWDGGGR